MKNFLLKITLFFLPIIVIGLFCYIQNEYISKYNIDGDLATLGQIKFDKSYCKIYNDTLAVNFVMKITIEELNNISDSVQILTIGDSFSQQGVRGFQNYLGSCLNKKIYNLQYNFKENYPEELFCFLLNNFDTLPQVIIVESVERAFVERLASHRRRISVNEDNQKNNHKSGKLERIQETFKKKLNVDNPVKQVYLSNNMFTCQGKENELYFYQDDILKFMNSDIQLAVNNLDTMSNLAKQRGIIFIYMVAVDKYDLYQDFIIDNPYPPKTFLDDFQPLDTSMYVNTKTILLPMLENGVKDVYYADNTHWSPIAAKEVAKHLAIKLAHENDSLVLLKN